MRNGWENNDLYICQWQAGKQLPGVAAFSPGSQQHCTCLRTGMKFAHLKGTCLLQAGLGPAAASIFLQPSEFGENLETSTLQNPVTDVTDAPEAFTAQYLSEVGTRSLGTLACCTCPCVLPEVSFKNMHCSIRHRSCDSYMARQQELQVDRLQVSWTA